MQTKHFCASAQFYIVMTATTTSIFSFRLVNSYHTASIGELELAYSVRFAPLKQCSIIDISLFMTALLEAMKVI